MNNMEDQNQNFSEAANSAEETPQASPSNAAAAPPAPEPAAPDFKAQAAENLAGWQRALADYANLKRESERGAAEFARYAAAGLVERLLPVKDSFAKAHASYPADGDAAALAKWAEGIGHIKSQFDGVLKAAGVTTIDQADVPFDPALHEAMMMEPAADGVASGIVTKILEPGYKMHDRVLRAAKVTVTE